LSLKKQGQVFNNPLNIGSKAADLNFDSNKLEYIYSNIKQINLDKDEQTPLIGFCGGPLTVFLFMLSMKGLKII
jgi:uroporphyrinogen decarboxylase